MKKIWTDEAWDDYEYWLNQDKKTVKRINKLLKETVGIEKYVRPLEKSRSSR